MGSIFIRKKRGRNNRLTPQNPLLTQNQASRRVSKCYNTHVFVQILPDLLTVGKMVLDHLILVRIEVGQPMSFKIVSTVFVSASKPGEKPVDHPVLTRERQLHSGEKISISGSVTYDIEARGGWISAKGELRVIDDKTIGIRWRPTLAEALFRGVTEHETPGIGSIISEAKEYAKWEEEEILQIKEGETKIDLINAYWNATLPETFNLADRLRIKPLTEEMLNRLEGYKSVERKTELIYEP